MQVLGTQYSQAQFLRQTAYAQNLPKQSALKDNKSSPEETHRSSNEKTDIAVLFKLKIKDAPETLRLSKIITSLNTITPNIVQGKSKEQIADLENIMQEQDALIRQADTLNKQTDEEVVNEQDLARLKALREQIASKIRLLKQKEPSKDEQTETANTESQTKETPENESGKESKEQKILAILKEKDEEVRRHEHAHLAAGGTYLRGGVQYTYKKGPDNQMYAVEGKVFIDITPVEGNPYATIKKMQTVKKAALAPANPSPEDRKIAALAEENEKEARSIVKQSYRQKNVKDYDASKELQTSKYDIKIDDNFNSLVDVA